LPQHRADYNSQFPTLEAQRPRPKTNE
jgi:hypothetical protein